MATMDLDDRFWKLFGAIWLVVGLGFLLAGLAAILLVDPALMDEPDLLWVFLVLGAIAATTGAAILYHVRDNAARDRRLLEVGERLTATITDIRESLIRIRYGRFRTGHAPAIHERRWHVLYRYHDNIGRMRSGRSRALPAEAVEGLKPGDEVRIAVDPRRPDESLLLNPGLSAESRPIRGILAELADGPNGARSNMKSFSSCCKTAAMAALLLLTAPVTVTESAGEARLDVALAVAADFSPVYPSRSFPSPVTEISAAFRLAEGESYGALTGTWIAVGIG